MQGTAVQPHATWRDYARLARLELIGLGLGPIYGALCVRGAELPAAPAAALFAIQFFIMAGGTIHNDLLDEKYDRQSPTVAGRPLARGVIPRGRAWVLAGCCLAAALGLVAAFFPSPLAFAVLFLIFIFTALYNHLGKRFEGGDLLYAVTLTLICLLGAVAVLPGAPGQGTLPARAWLLLAISFLGHVYFNAVPGGLKDLENDRRSGIRTLAVRLSRPGPNGGTILSPAFKNFAMGLRLAAVLGLFIPFMTGPARFGQAALLALGGAMMLVMAARLVNTPGLARERIGKYSGLGESWAFFSLTILLMDIAGPAWTIFLLMIPNTWFMFFNYLLHGRTTRMPPHF